MMKAQQGQQYIRTINCTEDNLAICIFSNEQLEQIIKYCVRDGDTYSPIHVDTTYKLTDMYALVLTIRAVECEGDPILMRPVLLTQRTREIDYRVLFSEITKHRPYLQHAPLTFVTDGEESIINALKFFQCASFFRCILHLKQNIKDQAKKQGLGQTMINIILQDVDELLALTDTDFELKCKSLPQEWRKVGTATHSSSQLQLFIKYFQHKIIKIIQGNNVQAVTDAGCTRPSDNNASESLNAQLKNYLSKSNLPVNVLIKELIDFIENQNEEMRKMSFGLSQKYVNRMRDFSQTTDASKLENTPESFSFCDLNDDIPLAVLQKLEKEAEKVTTIQNSEGTKYFAALCGNEYIVNITKGDVKCPCDTAKRLNICQHIMAVINSAGISTFRNYIKNRKSKTITTSSLLSQISGNKPGTPKSRKGGTLSNYS